MRTSTEGRASAQTELSAALAAIENTPTDGSAWVRASRAMVSLGAAKDAVKALRQATQICPLDPEIHVELGHVLGTLSMRDEPAACYRRALQIDPNHTGALVRLGLILLHDAELDEAGQCFVRVLQRDPANSAATAGAALVLDRRGLADDAWTLLAESPARPSIPLALARARVALHTGTQRDALPMLKSQQRRARGHDLAMLQHAEGDLHHELGQHAQAWKAWTRGNDNRGQRFDPDVHERTIDLLIDATRSLPRATGPADDRPVFIVGMMRSGSTLTESILDMHPAITGVGELEAIRDLSTRIPAALGGSSYLSHIGRLSEVAPELGRAYLDHVAVMAPKARHIVDKMPNNALHLGLISVMLPGAKVVWTERDPDDVALSCYQRVMSAGHPWTTTVAGIRAWQIGLERLKAHWQETLDLPIHTVRYEDLVTQPESTVRALADFVGVDFDPAMLSFHEKNRNVKTASWDQVTEKMHTRRIGRSAPYARFLSGV